MTSILATILIFFLIVYVHELGHYLAARLVNLHVTRFSVGFGPRLVGRTVAGTDFSIAAIPLGGFVSYAQTRDGSTPPRRKAFDELSILPRALVMGGGVAANVALAYLCLWAAALPWLAPPPQPAVTEPGVLISSVDPAGPAAQGGLKPGDRIVAVNGAAVSDWNSLQTWVAGAPEGRIDLAVRRDHQTIHLDVVPDQNKRIGISHIPAGGGFGLILASIGGTASQGIANPSSLTKNIDGPIAVTRITGKLVRQGLRTTLILVAVLSINIAGFNLLPIPGLDGGYFLFLFYEGLTGRKLSSVTQRRLQTAGLLLVVCAIYAVFYFELIGKG